nr:hypothetical protein CFP56_23632 [Quercus suber]
MLGSLCRGLRYDNDSDRGGETHYDASLFRGIFPLTDTSHFFGRTPPQSNQGQKMTRPAPFCGAGPSAQFPSHSPTFAGSLAPFCDQPDEIGRECTIPISPLPKILRQSLSLSHALIACVAALFSSPFPTFVGPWMRP